VLYTRTSCLLADLGGGHADGTWESRLRRYLKPDLLLLDDFGMKELTLRQAEDIYELIEGCSRGSSLVVASNRSPQDLYPLFPNPVLAEGVLEHLINKAHHVILAGKSYCPQVVNLRVTFTSFFARIIVFSTDKYITLSQKGRPILR